MNKKLTIGTAGLLLLVLAAGCTLQPAESNEESDLRVGRTYTLRADIGAKREPAAVSYAAPAFEAKSGQTYRIAEVKNGFARVEQSGWIPVWYFTQEIERVRSIQPEVRIVSWPVCVQIIPVPLSEAETVRCLNDPAAQKLKEGAVVRLLRSYDDKWYVVEFAGGESVLLANQWQWVPASALEPYSPERARDGRIRPGAIVYDVETKQPRRSAWRGYASIAEELPGSTVGLPGRIYLVYGPGGKSGYIRKEDFLPNPFEE